MNRIDSGFVESYLPKVLDEEPTTVQRSNTASTRRRKPKKNTSGSVKSVQPADMDIQRPASERRPRPSKQKSTASSSENSASRSKSRGFSSKPSSRRTSCTIVDPSRPARHYRMKSSQTAPTATSQDIDDVLALHFRSCSIFTNPSYHSHSGLPSPALSQGDAFAMPGAASRFNSVDIDVAEESELRNQSEETVTAIKDTNTTMHWTSPSTRQRDYERIDKANSGLRGLMRKAMPRCVSGPQEKFYEKDQSDAGSVRRYRMDDFDDHHANEKETLRLHTHAAEKPMARPTMKTRWTCF
ncbi:Nn.00g109330.m01.CDS01 [Neocucurbitaria sp. VM-36]